MSNNTEKEALFDKKIIEEDNKFHLSNDNLQNSSLLTSEELNEVNLF